jgi:2-polyprenyl-3-methyl-5-hydroxy-6-metoxy-1,4-benzoquinol methylase
MSECGACAGSDFSPFFRAREWSTTGHYLAVPVPSSAPVSIELEYCHACGLIRQVPDRVVKLDYVDIERGTAQQLPAYAGDIIARLSEFGVTADDLVLEVGANDGTFLHELRKAGFSNLLGVEPSTQLAGLASAAGFEIVNGYFDRQLAGKIVASHGPARAVICRHTLEHVPDIRELTAGIASAVAPGGVSFIEVPDADWVVTRLFAHELWDEHITYFRAKSLAKLVRRSGLTPFFLQRVRFRDTRNLICWSVREPTERTYPTSLATDEADRDGVAGFQKRWDVFSRRLQRVVADAPKPIIGFGASHIQLNFLNFSGLDNAVDILIDDDPAKTGRFAPLARPVPISKTSEILKDQRQGTLLRTAFPYPDWETNVIERLKIHGMGSIDPYELLSKLDVPA